MKSKQKMIENSNRDPEYLTIFLCAILAILGGTAKELSKFDTAFDIRRFFSNIFISGFSGLLIGLFAPDFEHKNWVMFAAGISGVAGIAFLDYCFDILKLVIRQAVKVNENKKDKE